ncbi:hypothetical protein Sme01_65160 [Sphaerisporangium melleum]|uniref:Uncharacterized protein n=1 Tax=Sphaerisporangium melleum TaxID=321316 RepID=A0A917REE5_9ACTN|nr:hypothetical protein GCM10007964_52140 [Sphaerisporangium melleum]GII74040.1 hypothetical protein Sme01_65160 [Sphaerisporangium melleum]
MVIVMVVSFAGGGADMALREGDDRRGEGGEGAADRGREPAPGGHAARSTRSPPVRISARPAAYRRTAYLAGRCVPGRLRIRSATETWLRRVGAPSRVGPDGKRNLNAGMRTGGGPPDGPDDRRHTDGSRPCTQKGEAE